MMMTIDCDVMMIMTIMSDDNEYNVADNDDGDNYD